MGQEFFVNSQGLEDKIRQLLPTQGGAGQNFDLSANTQIIPIIDLTESAEGSNLRADLQNAFSFDSLTTTKLVNASADIIVNTGYFRILGSINGENAGVAKISLNDGTSTKILYEQTFGTSNIGIKQFDLTVFVSAGDKVIAESTTGFVGLRTSTRQIATIDGELVNP